MAKEKRRMAEENSLDEEESYETGTSARVGSDSLGDRKFRRRVD